MPKSKKFMYIVFTLLIVSLLIGCGKDEGPFGKYEKMLREGEATTITVWNYYNSSQQVAFHEIVNRFNDTIGKEKRITVETTSFTSVTALADAVLKSCRKEPGASALPNIFQLYSDDLFNIDREYNIAAALDNYFSSDELALFVDGLIDEGRIGPNNELMLIPFAKSTEIFMMNKTYWDEFATATGADINKLNTLEGIQEIAEDYYNYSGEAFYGRDAIANMIFLNAQSLGKSLFTIDSNSRATATFDKALFEKMYNNYYVPYVKGHYSSVARYRSDDVKTTDIISYIGSTASAGYFPESVTINDTQTKVIDSYVLAPQLFAGAEKYAFSQGAGFAVNKRTEKEEYASAVFLKYITSPEENIKVALNLEYLPVLKQSLDIEKIKATYTELYLNKLFPNTTPSASEKQNALNAVKYITTIKSYETSVKVFQEYRLYSSKPFINSAIVRKIFDSSIQNPFYASDRPTVTNNLINANDMIALIESDIASGADPVTAMNQRLEGNFEVWYNELVRIISEEIQK